MQNENHSMQMQEFDNENWDNKVDTFEMPSMSKIPVVQILSVETEQEAWCIPPLFMLPTKDLSTRPNCALDESGGGPDTEQDPVINMQCNNLLVISKSQQLLLLPMLLMKSILSMRLFTVCLQVCRDVVGYIMRYCKKDAVCARSIAHLRIFWLSCSG
jgi:hypothetical protein